MSTAKKRTIKYTAFITLLILTVTYFSLLSPTSAYFYKTETKETSIEFALFGVEEDQPLFENEDVLKFKGATKLADFNELLFDDVVEIKEVTLTNVGEANARILTHITPTDESVTKGLRYIAFVEKVENEPETVAEGETEETTTSAKAEKGSLKAELETLLGITESSTPEEVDTALNNYNEAFKANDDTVIAPGEKAKVTIVFWSEYDPAQTAAGGEELWQNAGSLAEIEYSCKVEIIASQDEDAAVESIFGTSTEADETTAAETTTE